MTELSSLICISTLLEKLELASNSLEYDQLVNRISLGFMGFADFSSFDEMDKNEKFEITQITIMMRNILRFLTHQSRNKCFINEELFSSNDHSLNDLKKCTSQKVLTSDDSISNENKSPFLQSSSIKRIKAEERRKSSKGDDVLKDLYKFLHKRYKEKESKIQKYESDSSVESKGDFNKISMIPVQKSTVSQNVLSMEMLEDLRNLLTTQTKLGRGRKSLFSNKTGIQEMSDIENEAKRRFSESKYLKRSNS